MSDKNRSAPPTGTVPLVREADGLFAQVRSILLEARQRSYSAVNANMVKAYWHIGRHIVEFEQAGQARAAYGQRVLPELSRRLTQEFGAGFSQVNLKYFRQFYQCFPIGHTVCDDSDASANPALPALTWSHFRMLLRVSNADARTWYAQEAVTMGWSVRALDRQISTLYFERLLSSQNPPKVKQEAESLIAQQAAASPLEFIRDPYVLEFLQAQPGAVLYEKDVEQGLLNQLQKFLLELGKGFAFVARQRHLRIESEDAFVDLVFYNYILKCFVLIELKVGKLSHQDVGQLDMYVRVFDEQIRQDGDNPTIGLILCSERNEAVARYSLLAGSEQIFASRYQPWLPTEVELQAELTRDRALIEDAHARRASDSGPDAAGT
jgi:predicted nuclease of restriction endonuclease-like (RecB) superfamily